ncbi:hypothetical protein ACEPAH_37 [Sanghuangporus vaninii]
MTVRTPNITDVYCYSKIFGTSVEWQWITNLDRRVTTALRGCIRTELVYHAQSESFNPPDDVARAKGTD